VGAEFGIRLPVEGHSHSLYIKTAALYDKKHDEN